MEKEITMKKLILFTLLAIIMAGCSEPSTQQSQQEVVKRHPKYEIAIIDSCEYIVCYSIGGDRAITYTRPIYIHKGNCSFCAERRRKEQEELIRKIRED